MRQATLKDAIDRIKENVSEKIIKYIKKSEGLFYLTLEDKESFLSLIWLERNGLRLLASGNSRTLGDVCQEMATRGLTFKNLASNLGIDNKIHDPKWFENCVVLEKNFTYEKFGLLIVVPANDSERKQSPKGSFYIIDGAHRSLVLGKLLLSNEVNFQPIELLLMLPEKVII